jgi:hypothetical protein
MSIAAKVAVDEQAKTLALDRYEAAPTLLKNVKRQPRAAS